MKKPHQEPIPNSTVSRLLREIDRFIKDTDISESRIGREVMGDTSLVYRLRHGRDIYTGTVDEIIGYMKDKRRELGVPRKRKRITAKAMFRLAA
jgi:hypothetical protein